MDDQPHWPEAGPLRLLVICSANQCRSPLGEAIARHILRQRHVDAVVTSAGTRAIEGQPATDRIQAVARRLGLDLDGHRSRPIPADEVASADLIVTMERQHVLDLVMEHGSPLGATFTLPELAAATAVGDARRRRGESIREWLERVTAGRTAAGVLTHAPEIADPVGRSPRRHQEAAHEIDDALVRVLSSLFPPRTLVPDA